MWDVRNLVIWQLAEKATKIVLARFEQIGGLPFSSTIGTVNVRWVVLYTVAGKGHAKFLQLPGVGVAADVVLVTNASADVLAIISAVVVLNSPSVLLGAAVVVLIVASAVVVLDSPAVLLGAAVVVLIVASAVVVLDSPAVLRGTAVVVLVVASAVVVLDSPAVLLGTAVVVLVVASAVVVLDASAVLLGAAVVVLVVASAVVVLDSPAVLLGTAVVVLVVASAVVVLDSSAVLLGAAVVVLVVASAVVVLDSPAVLLGTAVVVLVVASAVVVLDSPAVLLGATVVVLVVASAVVVLNAPAVLLGAAVVVLVVASAVVVSRTPDCVVLEEIVDPDYEPTEDEISEYAKWLGMDVEVDKSMRWIAEEGLKAPLPEHWRPCRTHDTGEIYYFNFKSGESTWEHPCDKYYRDMYAREKKVSRHRAPLKTIQKKSKNVEDAKRDEGVQSKASSPHVFTTPIRSVRKTPQQKQFVTPNRKYRSNSDDSTKKTPVRDIDVSFGSAAEILSVDGDSAVFMTPSPRRPRSDVATSRKKENDDALDDKRREIVSEIESLEQRALDEIAARQTETESSLEDIERRHREDIAMAIERNLAERSEVILSNEVSLRELNASFLETRETIRGKIENVEASLARQLENEENICRSRLRDAEEGTAHQIAKQEEEVQAYRKKSLGDIEEMRRCHRANAEEVEAATALRQQELMRMQQQLETAHRESEMAERGRSEAVTTTNMLRESLEAAIASRDIMCSELETLKGDVTSAAQRVANLKSEVVRKDESTAERLRASQDKMTREMQDCAAKLVAAERDREAADEAHMAECARIRRDASEENMLMRSRIVELEAQVSTLRESREAESRSAETAAQANVQLTSLENRLEELSRSRSTLLDQVVRLKHENESIAYTSENLESEMQCVRRQITEERTRWERTRSNDIEEMTRERKRAVSNEMTAARDAFERTVTTVEAQERALATAASAAALERFEFKERDCARLSGELREAESREREVSMRMDNLRRAEAATLCAFTERESRALAAAHFEANLVRENFASKVEAIEASHTAELDARRAEREILEADLSAAKRRLVDEISVAQKSRDSGASRSNENEVVLTKDLLMTIDDLKTELKKASSELHSSRLEQERIVRECAKLQQRIEASEKSATVLEAKRGTSATEHCDTTVEAESVDRSKKEARAKLSPEHKTPQGSTPLSWKRRTERERKMLRKARLCLREQRRVLKRKKAWLVEERERWRHDVAALSACDDVSPLSKQKQNEYLHEAKDVLDEQIQLMNEAVRSLREADRWFKDRERALSELEVRVFGVDASNADNCERERVDDDADMARAMNTVDCIYERLRRSRGAFANHVQRVQNAVDSLASWSSMRVQQTAQDSSDGSEENADKRRPSHTGAEEHGIVKAIENKSTAGMHTEIDF
eukprot:g1366.t1